MIRWVWGKLPSAYLEAEDATGWCIDKSGAALQDTVQTSLQESCYSKRSQKHRGKGGSDRVCFHHPLSRRWEGGAIDNSLSSGQQSRSSVFEEKFL